MNNGPRLPTGSTVESEVITSLSLASPRRTPVPTPVQASPMTSHPSTRLKESRPASLTLDAASAGTDEKGVTVLPSPDLSAANAIPAGPRVDEIGARPASRPWLKLQKAVLAARCSTGVVSNSLSLTSPVHSDVADSTRQLQVAVLLEIAVMLNHVRHQSHTLVLHTHTRVVPSTTRTGLVT